MISTNLKNTVSDQLKELAWDTFFVSKNRGVTFEFHFPNSTFDKGTWSIEIRISSEVVGGLVVRERTVIVDNEAIVIGCIGLVCVKPQYRGNGLAGKLFESAIEESLKRGYSGLTLWTSQHHIYKNRGFFLYDKTVFGSVTIPVNYRTSSTNSESVILSPHCVIPPFAKEGRLYHSSKAQLVTLWDDKGGIIVDWNGKDIDVHDLILDVFKGSFRINARTECSLISLLKLKSYHMNINFSNLQMWLPLQDHININKVEAALSFTVLDRI